MFYTKILLFTSLVFAPYLGASHSELKTRSALPDCNVFTIHNESSYALGTIEVSGSGNSGYLDVTATGDYSDTLCFTPSAIEINGQMSAYPDTTIITRALIITRLNSHKG